jgi:hypothetical protein
MPTVSNPIQDLFTPIPENPVSRTKDHLDHVADYVDTSTGAWDIFRVIEHSLAYVKRLPSLDSGVMDLVEKVKGVAGSMGIGLSIPKIISDFNTLRRGLTNLFATQDLPYSDPLRTRKIAQVAKTSFINSIDFTNTLVQAAQFVDAAKVYLFDAVQLKWLDGANNLTSAISDGSELITECFKIHNYNSPEVQPRNPAEAAKLAEKRTLSWMIVAKDVASIAGSALALLGIVFGVATQSIAIVSISALALSTVWLTMKLATYFYNKIVVEAPSGPASRPFAANI